jgi:sodium-coupled monocarboxylate transporter 8/12
MFTITAGPIFGLFVAGMFFPWTNECGAIPGFIVSIALMCWLGIGTIIEKPSGYKPLPTNSTGCNWAAINRTQTTMVMTSSTMVMLNTTLTTATNEPILNDFYRISYQWYTGLGMIVCVFISVTISRLNRCSKSKPIDSRLMVPIFDILFPWLPERVLKPLRFGIEYNHDNNIQDEQEIKVDIEENKKDEERIQDSKSKKLENENNEYLLNSIHA